MWKLVSLHHLSTSSLRHLSTSSLHQLSTSSLQSAQKMLLYWDSTVTALASDPLPDTPWPDCRDLICSIP